MRRRVAPRPQQPTRAFTLLLCTRERRVSLRVLRVRMGVGMVERMMLLIKCERCRRKVGIVHTHAFYVCPSVMGLRKLGRGGRLCRRVGERAVWNLKRRGQRRVGRRGDVNRRILAWVQQVIRKLPGHCGLVSATRERSVKRLTLAWMRSRNHVIQHLDYIRQSLNPCSLLCQRVLQALMLRHHPPELCCDLGRQLDPRAAAGRLVVQGFAFDLVEQVDPALEELGMRELLRSALGTWCLVQTLMFEPSWEAGDSLC
jgi:hypothetical protein